MDSALQFLGLLYRGNQLIIGLDVENGLKKNKLKAIVFSEDISESSKKSLENLILENRVVTTQYSNKKDIGESLGKKNITMVGFKNLKSYQSFITKVEGRVNQ